MSTNEILMFTCDYQEGAHPNILTRLAETNLVSTTGYGSDDFCLKAKGRIRQACACPDAEVEFLIGGTQTNATVIDAILESYQGVVSADTGHVNTHEAGAIELGGHKVMAMPSELGKLNAKDLDQYLQDFEDDANHTHMVMPGLVYLSHPTEFGTLYSKQELTEISQVCRRHKIPLYVDGARMAYALAAPDNDITLADLAALTDVFYIGGTKCGALFGEAVVIPDSNFIPRFFTIMKQHGAVLAKGRLLGIQYDELFKDDLYLNIGKDAIRLAGQIKETLAANGFPLYFDSPTNQVFFVIENKKMEELSHYAAISFMQKFDQTHSVIRFCTSWASTQEKTDQLCSVIEMLGNK